MFKNLNKLKRDKSLSVKNRQIDHFPSQENYEKNPWQAAKRVHDDRIGDAYVRAYNWRIIALITSITAFIAVTGIIFVAAQKKFVPYVVEVDKLGNTTSLQFISKASAIDVRVERAYLSRFITDLRSVTLDPIPEKDAIYRVYSMLAEGTPALAVTNEYYKKDPPNERAKKEMVAVTVTSILPISDKTWQVEWTETFRNLQGSTIKTTRWKASLTIAINPPDTEKEIYINPLGMFVTHLSWAQQL